LALCPTWHCADAAELKPEAQEAIPRGAAIIALVQVCLALFPRKVVSFGFLFPLQRADRVVLIAEQRGLSMSMTFTVIAVTPDEVEQLAAEPESLDTVLRGNAGSSRLTSLEKSWHGLHFLLTGTSTGGTGPAAFLLLGGEPFGEDLGYGPARLVRPSDVDDIDATLSALTDDQLWSRFHPARMTDEGVYPVVWDENEADLREEYLHYFANLKDVVRQAKTMQGGLVLVME
jgi:Domain of unknown function (DUF1877)